MSEVTTGHKGLVNPPAITDVTESITLKSLKIELEITDTTKRDKVLAEVDRVCDALSTTDAVSDKLRLVLGRLMAVVQDRQLYMPQYETFEAYRMAIAEKYSLSRATVSRALGIVRALPSITPEQAEKIPEANLYTIAQAVRTAKKNDVRLPDHKVKALLEKAEVTPISEFRQVLEKQQLVAPRGAPVTGKKIIIRGTNGLIKAWSKYVGDDDPTEVLARLIGFSVLKRGRRPKRTAKSVDAAVA